jgi:hypothetical protein
MIELKDIEDREAHLLGLRSQKQAELQAIAGALQDCEFWRKWIEQKEKPA